MKTLKLFTAIVVAAVVFAGCSKPDETPGSTAGEAGAAATGKPGEMKGMSPDSVGVTTDGANADKMTGSKAGGG
jgi:PBP1b-binding outer membrane lipoprotein LpoB